jgi:hypothetical protein
LSNTISFSLTPSSVSSPSDVFGVQARVTAVPEPASLLMMSFGLPLPLLGLAWLRRHRRAETRAA